MNKNKQKQIFIIGSNYDPLLGCKTQLYTSLCNEIFYFFFSQTHCKVTKLDTTSHQDLLHNCFTSTLYNSGILTTFLYRSIYYKVWHPLVNICQELFTYVSICHPHTGAHVCIHIAPTDNNILQLSVNTESLTISRYNVIHRSFIEVETVLV